MRGAKFETAAAYANQTFVKPTIGDWGDDGFFDYNPGLDVPPPAPSHHCHSGR